VFVAPRMVGHFGMVDITAARYLVFGAVSGIAVFARPAAVRWPTAGRHVAALGLSVLGFSGYYLLLAFGIQAAGTEVASSTPPTGPTGSAWLATILWNVASQRLSASLCGQLVVSETLFALVYSFAWDGRWPQATEWVAALLFVLGILASIKAHR
jgi:drug/metabolite transporter (DMT)-like permease